MAGIEAQKQIRDNTKEIHDYIKELQDWEKEVKSKDGQLKSQAKRSSKERELPPVRGRPKPSSTPTTAAKHTYDCFRDKWDKFDVDAALREVDQDADNRSEGAASEHESAGTPQIFASRQRKQEETHLADAASEKELGNKFFKEKKYVQAIECYSKSLVLQPTAVAYANRAMALLKIRRFEDAELDCSEAISLDDRYTKAYARRGTARMERDKPLEAAEDFEFALRLEPQNKELQKQYQEAKQAYEKKNTFRPPEKKVQLKAKGTELGSTHPTAAELAFPTAKTMSAMEIDKEVIDMDIDKKDKFKEMQAAALRAAAAAQSAVVQNMAAPRTSYEFETLWRALAEDKVAKARAIKLVSPSSLPRIFKDSLGAVLMMDIVHTLESFFPDDATFAIDILENIVKVGRFSMTLMFLSENDKASLRRLWTTWVSSAAISIENIEKLEWLGSKFRL